MADFNSSSTKPVVSVIIPTRDCLPYLPTAIASVEAQAVAGVEILVIDDGSSDGSAEWLRAKQRSSPWLTLIEGFGDGPNAARNRGIEAAAAPLLAFLDADDSWLPGKLGPQLAFHQAAPDVSLSFTDYLHVDTAGHEYGTCFEYWPAFGKVATKAAVGSMYCRLSHASARLLAENVVGTSTVVVRKKAVQNLAGFDTSLRSAADWDLWLRLAAIGAVGFTTALGTNHIIHRTGSVSADGRLRIACMRRILATHAPAVVVGPGGAAAVRRARANVLATEADLARAEGRHRAAIAARLGSLWRTPSKRLARAATGDVLRAICMGRRLCTTA